MTIASGPNWPSSKRVGVRIIYWLIVLFTFYNKAIYYSLD